MYKSITCRILTLIMLLTLPTISYGVENPLLNYQSYIEVKPGITNGIPAVIEVPLPVNADRVLVQEVSTTLYLASQIERKQVSDGVLYNISQATSSDGFRGELSGLLDRDSRTDVDFIVSLGGTQVKADLYLNANQSTNVSELTIDYAVNTALPKQVSLYALKAGQEELITSKTGFEVRRLVFPERNGQSWRVSFIYDQPVRISNLQLGPVRSTSVVDAVRFLAQPSQTYRVYLYPEKEIYVSKRDSGSLFGVKVSFPEFVSTVTPNPLFTRSDSDDDGVPDISDNCPNHVNPDQISSRGFKGDICDDFDNDTVINGSDNCPYIPNQNQLDNDFDYIGDVCDESESRLTEQYPWLPWVGMGITIVVIISLFVSVARRPLPLKETEEDDEDSEPTPNQ